MRWRGLFVLVLMITGVVALANAARHTLLRQPLLEGAQVKLEQSYTLAGVVPDDLVVLAQDITLLPESRVAISEAAPPSPFQKRRTLSR